MASLSVRFAALRSQLERLEELDLDEASAVQREVPQVIAMLIEAGVDASALVAVMPKVAARVQTLHREHAVAAGTMAAKVTTGPAIAHPVPPAPARRAPLVARQRGASRERRSTRVRRGGDSGDSDDSSGSSDDPPPLARPGRALRRSPRLQRCSSISSPARNGDGAGIHQPVEALDQGDTMVADKALKDKDVLLFTWPGDDPPEEIVELDGDLGELVDEANTIRKLLCSSPVDVTYISWLAKQLVPCAAECDASELEELAKQQRGTAA